MENKFIIILFVILIFIIIYYIFEKKFIYDLDKKKLELKNIFENNNNEMKKYTPKILIQTYHDKSKVPQKVYDNIKKYASEYEHIILDDQECIKFLEENYNEEIIQRFKSLKKGCHKADLFRYCWLYKMGGVYLDIKVILIKDIKDIFIDDTKLYSVLSSYITFGNYFEIPRVFQGIISTPPNNPLFIELISKCLIRTTEQINKKSMHMVFTKDFYKSMDLNKDLLFDEVCNTSKTKELEKDRYGHKCAVYDKNERIFITRYTDYPW